MEIINDDDIIVKVKITGETLNPFNIVHGGLIFSIGDTAMGFKIKSLGKNAVTLNSSINFISPGVGKYLIATCKIIKDGKEYCDTRQYWTGKSCTSDYSGGSTNRVDMKCTKTGELKYYCSITGKYTTSKPSCTDTEKENLISTTTTSYSCPTGYDSTGNLDKNSVCTKTVVYDVY